MRRKDREMSREFALEVIDNSQYGVLGICKDTVYTIPLSIAREGDYLYFHSAPEGRKVQMIEDGDRVSLSFVSYNQVPYFMDRDRVIKALEEKNYKTIGSKVYTTEFHSAHVLGQIEKIIDKKEIIRGLKILAKKYRPDIDDLSEEFILNSLDRVSLYRIQILEIKGKRKEFDKNEEELKFQRQE